VCGGEELVGSYRVRAYSEHLRAARPLEFLVIIPERAHFPRAYGGMIHGIEEQDYWLSAEIIAYIYGIAVFRRETESRRFVSDFN
jgi:hypothetical protein